VKSAVSEPLAPSPWERLSAALALLVPLVVTVFRAQSASDWRDDVPAVSGIALLPLGGEGLLGLLGDQVSQFLPVGGRWLRAAWVTSIALALASRLIYGRAHVLLAKNSSMPALAPLLALAAALTAVLSPTFQLEGTVIGGGVIGALVALLTLTLRERLPSGDVRSSVLVGALLALTAVESHAAALALAVALVARALVRRERPDLVLWLSGAAGALVVGLFLAAFLFLRSVAPGAWLDLGFGLGQSSLTAGDVEKERLTALGSWLADVGLIPLALSAFGFGTALFRPGLRRPLVPLLALVFVDLALPAAKVGAMVHDPFAPARLLSLAALGIGAALGVQSAVLALLRVRVPFARPAAVLLVAFHFTLVFASSEASAQATERRASIANEVWTDEGFSGLPPRALLLARSEALAYRLWAAQLVRGERPDVVVVPVSLLERGALRRRLLAAEPALSALLRDIALSGRPGEYALSTLADARPLFIELDSTWDERLSEHVVPEAFWLRFHPNPVGRSDRTLAVERAGSRFERVVSAVTPGGGIEAEATRAVVVASLRQRALFLSTRRDYETTAQTLDRLVKLEPDDEVAAKLRAELERHAQKRRLAEVLPAL
jgi:hypothetical protein